MTRADGWRLHVAHETRFDYNAPARASYNELRLTPRTERRQTALETKMVTVPPAPQYSYVDYWGTQVVAFNIDRGHEMLSITGSALIDTQRSEDPEDASWAEVTDASLTMADHLSHKLYTAPGAELAELAHSLRDDRPLHTARQILERTHESLRYVRGVTSVHTSAYEAFVDGAGVCQDFAHLALAMTKSVGLPSRYVSGYFHPEPEAVIGEEIVGESHAWVEVWTGSWWGYDPTNDCPVGERHVAIGRGRDYSDVPPVKGIYAGNAEHTMKVKVHITRTTERARPHAHLAARRPGRVGGGGGRDRRRRRQRGRARGTRARGGRGHRRVRRRAARRRRRGRRGVQGIRNIPGAGVEEVRVLAGAVQDREDAVLNAAAAILQAATPTAAMNALSGQLISLFDLTWLAVADLGTESFVEVHGEVPTIAWVAAFATGSQSGSDPSNDTTNSGVFVEAVPETELTVCGGRPAPIRRRERHAASPCWSSSRPASSTPWGGANTPTDRGGARRGHTAAASRLVSASCCGSGLSGRA